jgi:hypothetical protein
MIGVASALGTPISKAAAATCPPTGPVAFTSYLNWYDNVSPGMGADNIHIVNTGTGPFSGCVIVGTQGVSFGAGPGQETYVSMPAGTYGGPVTVTLTAWLSGAGYIASQRIRFYSSFNELPSVGAGAATTTSFFNWYDNASPGMFNDNIHLLNPGTTSASVTVSLPGATSQTATVGAGAETYVKFPKGTIGGPVTVTSTQPVLASQRVQYNQTFNEVWAASSTQAATKSYLNWYDKASPGMFNDNIHLLNAGTTSASVTVSLPGATPKTVSVAGGAETYVNFPGAIGGPVTVTSTQPVLAAQRIQFNSSFNEIWSASPSSAGTTKYFNWYDRASPGMSNDNIHILNPGTVDATVTISLTVGSQMPSQTVTVTAGAEKYVNFGAAIGGPVKISSTQAVLASQRVQYYQSFNETWAG